MNRGATTTTSRATTSPSASRTPVSRSSSTSSRGDLAVDDRDARGRRAARARRRRARGRCAGRASRRRSSCRHISAWCTRHRAGREDADRAGRAPPSRGSRGSAARRGPTARPRPGTSGSSSTSPVVTSSRRAATAPAVGQADAGTRRRPGRSAVAPGRSRNRAAVPGDLGPADREQLGRRRALPAQVVVHVAGRRVARLARVDHQHRAPGPRRAPAPRSARPLRRRPPPRRTARPCPLPRRPVSAARLSTPRARWQVSLPVWQRTIGRRRAGRGRPAAAGAPRSSAARPWPSCPRRPASR